MMILFVYVTVLSVSFTDAFEYFADVQHSSLMLYRTMQPEYKSAEYLSVVNCRVSVCCQVCVK